MTSEKNFGSDWQALRRTSNIAGVFSARNSLAIELGVRTTGMTKGG